MAEALKHAHRLGGVSLDDFQRMRAAFCAAWERQSAAPPPAIHEFAALPVHMRIVDAGRARAIEAAFAHLAQPRRSGDEPALRIDIWDEVATGITSPVSFAGTAVGEDWRLVAFGSDAWSGIYDRANSHLIAALHAAAPLSLHERGHPLSPLLLIWYADRGFVLLHAGLVNAEGRAILFAGGAESGKSTTVYACAHAGFAAMGDDCAALAIRADGRCTAYSVYRSMLIDTRVVRYFNGTSGDGEDLRGRELVHADLALASSRRTADVAALLLPRVAGGPGSALEPLRRGEALRDLLPAVLTMAPIGSVPQRGFAALTGLLDRVPCYRLSGGTEWRALADAVRAALR